MANKRKKKATQGPLARKVASKRIASVYEARTGGNTIHRAAGRATREDAVQRGGLEACEGCRDRALQERDKSRALAADAELEIRGRDTKVCFSEMEASVSLEKGLKLAVEAVEMKAEEDRLQVELGLRTKRQHRAWKGNGRGS